MKAVRRIQFGLVFCVAHLQCAKPSFRTADADASDLGAEVMDADATRDVPGDVSAEEVGTDAPDADASEAGEVSVDVPDAEAPPVDAPADADAPVDADASPDAPCPSGQTRCAGMCVDTEFSHAHCGACGNGCAEGRVCAVGRCVVGPSPLGLGETHSCVLNTGDAGTCTYCWGANEQCQLANGAAFDSDGGVPGADASASCASIAPSRDGAVDLTCDPSSPIRSPRRATGVPADARTLSGRGTCAIVSMGDPRPGGRVVCWGSNTEGQLGDGTWTRRATPVEVRLPAEVRVVQVASGIYSDAYTTCAVTTRGELYCWGMNTNARIGDGPGLCNAACRPPMFAGGVVNCEPLPRRIELPGGERVVQVAVGQFHVCAATRRGPVLCWGYDLNGQLGDGTPATVNVAPASAVPVALPADVEVEQLVANASNTCVLARDGRVYCWGDQSDCLLGSGVSATNRATPGPVLFPSDTVIKRLALGEVAAFALDYRGRVWSWGRRNPTLALDQSLAGMPCDGRLNDAGAPERAGLLTPTLAGWLGARRYVEITAGQQHACAIDDGGDVWCWGQLAPLGGTTRADAGVDPNVAYVGSLRGGLGCE